jgi:hypothetical protein
LYTSYNSEREERFREERREMTKDKRQKSGERIGDGRQEKGASNYHRKFF